MIDIVLISINSPIVLGLYKDYKLHSFISIDGKTSDILPALFSSIFNLNHDYLNNLASSKIINLTNESNIKSLEIFTKYCSKFKLQNIKRIFYCRGPGGLTSIKLTHVFLHSISISKNITLSAANCFYFSDLKEIKAFNNMSFFLNEANNLVENITLGRSINPETSLKLPNILKVSDFKEPCLPQYITAFI